MIKSVTKFDRRSAENMLEDSDRVIDEFAAHLRNTGRQDATADSYCRDARAFETWVRQNGLTLSGVDPGSLEAFEGFLRHERAERENSIRRTVIGIRQFYRFLVDSRLISATPFDEVPIPQRHDGLPQALTKLDVERILAAAENDSARLRGARNLAIVAALAFEGLKASELIELTWGDYMSTPSAASLHIRGARSRAIVLLPETKSYFDVWRQLMLESGGGPDLPRDQKVFAAFQGRDGSTLLQHMTRHGLKFVMYELGEAVGMRHLNTELLRHHAVSQLLALGRSIEDIQNHLGLRRPGIVARHAALQDSDAQSQDKSDA